MNDLCDAGRRQSAHRKRVRLVVRGTQAAEQAALANGQAGERAVHRGGVVGVRRHDEIEREAANFDTVDEQWLEQEHVVRAAALCAGECGSV